MQLDQEEWRPVIGYEGIYWVSNFGRVKNVKHHVLVFAPNRLGYFVSRLSKNRCSKSAILHRLVAKAFVPNPLGLPEVDHVDGIKSNNRPSNLEWVTRAENMQRAAALGLLNPPDNRGEKNGQAKLTEEDIWTIFDLRGRGWTQQAVADVFGVSRRLVGMILKGDRWAHAIIL